MYGIQTEQASESKLKVGDKVRIKKKKSTIEKGYTPGRTEEVFTTSQIQYTDPITYKIIDSNGEEIQGIFYEPELQKSKQEVFRIEKIIKKRGKSSAGYQYLVKWIGYPDKMST